MTDPVFQDSKPWYTSRTILASIAVVVAQSLALTGIDVDSGMLTEVAVQVVSLVGGLIAVYGRFAADKRVA